METFAINYEERSKEEVMLTIKPHEYGRLQSLLEYRKQAAARKTHFLPETQAYQQYESVIKYSNDMIKEILGL